MNKTLLRAGMAGLALLMVLTATNNAMADPFGFGYGHGRSHYRPAVERRAYIQQHAPAVPVHGHHHYAPVVPEISVRPYYRPRRVYVDSYYVPAVRVVTPRVVVRVPF